MFKMRDSFTKRNNKCSFRITMLLYCAQISYLSLYQHVFQCCIDAHFSFCNVFSVLTFTKIENCENLFFLAPLFL